MSKLPIDALQDIDNSTKQLMIFLELAKAGIIIFDMSNPLQKDYLDMIVAKAASFNPEDYKDQPDFIRITAENNHMIYCLIVNEITKHIKQS